MDNQPSTGGSIVPVKRDGEDLVDEQIDERILRLLGLEYIFDIDYDTYTSLLKEKMVAARMAKTQIPTEEAELLTNEYKKIRGKKGRFKVKKITADSFKKGSAVGVNLGKQKALVGKPLKALPPAPDKMTGGEDIKEIIDALAEIIKSLTSQNKLAKDSAEKSRIAGEAGQRGAKESRLEKGFKFAIKAAEKVIAPIKSLLDRIIDFFVAIFVGRALIKLLDWFSDSKNQDKIKAIGRFLGDQWPKLLALYLVFGNSFGRFALRLVGLVAKGAVGLLAKIVLLNKAKKAQAAGRFLSGKGGKGVAGALATTALIGGTLALTQGLKGDDESIEKDTSEGKKQKTQGYSGGGFVMPKIPAFKGGGLNFKGMFGGASGSGTEKSEEISNGFVSGQKGVDKVPAMLSDGEFVMSVGAVQKYGVDTLESMNAAGGGTNQPKIVGGKTYAAGGGEIKSKKEPVGDIGDGRPKNPLSNLISSATNMFTDKKSKPEKYGPPVPEFNRNRYVDPLMKASSAMQKEGWSFRGDPKNGCAPAINEVYKRAGIKLPWEGVENINYVPKIYERLEKSFVRVSEKDRKSGDIVIWNDPRPEYGGKDPEPYGHIGIVMKDGRIANNSSGAGAFTNLMTPEESKSSWKNTKELIYFRNPEVHKSYQPKPEPKKEPNKSPYEGISGIVPLASQMMGALSKLNPASLLANALGGSSAKAQTNAPPPKPSKPTKPKPMGNGGFLDTLGGLGVPGTGTVMAPRSSGPRDIRGNQQTDPGFQSKFLGIPLGSPTSGASSRFGMTAPLGPGGDVGGYTEAQKKRYTSRTGSSFVPTSYAGSISGAMGDSHLRFPGLPSLQNKKIEIPDYMMPSNISKSQQPKSDKRSENDKLIGESFKNFRKNVQTIKGAAKKQEEMMRELGVKPDGYVNMRGQKLNLGPQSKAMPIEPPSKSKVKVVYATSPGGMPKLNTSSGASPSVPSFSAVHPNSESRRRSAAVLGVK